MGCHIDKHHRGYRGHSSVAMASMSVYVGQLPIEPVGIESTRHHGRGCELDQVRMNQEESVVNIGEQCGILWNILLDSDMTRTFSI